MAADRWLAHVEDSGHIHHPRGSREKLDQDVNSCRFGQYAEAVRHKGGSSQSSLVGTWKVATGSEAGYRVKEKFINQPATTEAVARTPKIAGGLAVTSAGSELVAANIHFTAT